MTIEEMRAAFLALAEASEIKHRKEHHKAARDFEAVAESWRQTAEVCSRLDRIAEELERQGRPVEIITDQPPKNS